MTALVLPLALVGVIVGVFVVFVIGAALDWWLSDRHAHNRARDARWLAHHVPPPDTPDTPDMPDMPDTRDDMSA